jgi:putative endonuclease
MKTIQQQTGGSGEDLAAGFLKKNGYTIITRNYRYRKSELDIVCKKKNTIVVVEVKSIKTLDYGYAEERIVLKKQRQIIKATYAFLNEYYKFKGKEMRFDVITVNMDHQPAEINHYQAAFWQK